MIVFSVFALSASVFNFAFADSTTPMAVQIVHLEPYYFSHAGLGAKILKYNNQSLAPYLISGKTTEQSSIQDVIDAYQNANPTNSTDESKRAVAYSVEFYGGDLPKPSYKFSTFLKFTPLKKSTNNPATGTSLAYGLELESLPSKDKNDFYNDIVAQTINPAKKPSNYGINVAVLTGDGSAIQTWEYKLCNLHAYTPYLDSNGIRVKFTEDFASEIKEKAVFSCGGFKQNFVLVNTQGTNSTVTPAIPSKDDRADRYVVQIHGGKFTTTQTFYSFSNFSPLTRGKITNLAYPGNVIGSKPEFALESLPTADKESYYRFISDYINPGTKPQLMDVTIHILTGKGEDLQVWRYTACTVNNFATYFNDNLLVFKFKQSSGSEIRDKTFFACSGLVFNPTTNVEKVDTSQAFAPDDSTRAQVFVVHFKGSDINGEQTVTSFTKFSPIVNEEMKFLLPNAPIGKTPRFYLESNPGKDNGWYYQLISKYINPGTIPGPLDITVDVLLGNGGKLQSWNYGKCEVLYYNTYLDATLYLKKFTNQFQPEFRDRTIFQCTGLGFDGALKLPKSAPAKTLDYVDFVQSEKSRVARMVTTFSGGELQKPFTLYTIGAFIPKIEQRSQSTVQVVKPSVVVTLSEVPSKPSTYDKPPYCGPGERPPGCIPCPPNNPHCGSGGGGGGGGDCEDSEDDCGDCRTKDDCGDCSTRDDCGDCRSDDDCGDGGEEGGGGEGNQPPNIDSPPGVSNPPVTVSIVYPHLSTADKNNYIKSTQFTLISLPSKEKMPYYDLVSREINPGSKPGLFDVTFDYVSGDNTIIQSWKYAKCDIVKFDTRYADKLVNFPFSGVMGKADITEVSTLQCDGFAVDMNQKPSGYDMVSPIPSLADSAAVNVAHWEGGELANQRTSAMIQKYQSTEGTSSFSGGLPNVHNKDAYQFVSRYLNPGNAIQPIDMRYDTITGDGSMLFSSIYKSCTVTGAATYVNDNLAVIKYAPTTKPEIREQASTACTGFSFKTTPLKDNMFDVTGNMRSLAPAIQSQIGVPADSIRCKGGYDLMTRPPANVAACIKTDQTAKLEQRGWKHPTVEEKQNLTNILRPVLPANNEKASTISAQFEGADINPSPRTIDTFTKFAPIRDSSLPVLIPDNSFANIPPKLFYLESLPNKDNSWFYGLVSKYTNPGSPVEPFSATITVKSGGGDTLQIWKYKKCQVTDYTTFYDDSLLTYKFHGMWNSEIKDRAVFSCSGFTLNES